MIDLDHPTVQGGAHAGGACCARLECIAGPDAADLGQHLRHAAVLAAKAIEFGIPALMRDDWKNVFEPEEIAESIRRIT
ncbi:phosphogluconate dehydrogenase C-terminal domain-containing protein [Bacillus paralicheniformis]|uniref:phosphogluconate dehydrogenase C-terminal domain-containing protein n=1 Tax=Bacillus paralicheniformis TaxID=1648923 RepID=UPI0023AA507B|nr:phosphogluconate dehydrogenase C-terminal domain-containing protein [Bacillus paralicheniformis]